MTPFCRPIAVSLINQTSWSGIKPKPGSDPIKRIHSINLHYVGSEHTDWMIMLSSQSECVKNYHSVKFTLKIFIGSGPGSDPFNKISSIK